MSAVAGARWREAPERGTVFALWLIHGISKHLGRGAGRAVLYAISLYFLLLAPGPRRSSRRYLGRVLGREAGWRDVFRHIYAFAATILDRVFFLAGEFDRFEVTVHGGALLQEQVATGQGCLLLSAHLGSFEALRVLGVLGRQLPLKVVMDVEQNAAITRFIHKLNPKIAETILPHDGVATLLAVREWVAQGHVIGLLGDRVVPPGSALPCRFLGSPAPFPTGPWELAGLLGCPVLLAVALYRGGNRYELFFERLADAVPPIPRRRPEAARPWVERFVGRLEHFARRAPLNWFNFYDFWNEEGDGGGRDGCAT